MSTLSTATGRLVPAEKPADRWSPRLCIAAIGGASFTGWTGILFALLFAL
jgi:hypothetical protein